MDVAVKVASNPTGDLTSVVSAAAVEADPVSGNNTASATTNVGQNADVSVTISDAPDPVTAGTNLVYTLGVANNGPSTATGVALTLTLDADVSYQSFTGAGWSCNQGTPGIITCTRSAGLGPLATDVVDVTVKVALNPTGDLTSAVSAAAVEADPVSGNNTASATTSVNLNADLSLTLGDLPDPVTAGTNLVYTMTVVNNGPRTATGVVLTLTIDPGVSYLSFAGANWSCSEGVTGTVTCTRAAALSALASDSVDVTVKVDPAQNGSLSTDVSVDAVEPDPAVGNNQGTINTAVQRQADVSITMTDSPDPVLAGQDITYSLRI